MRNGIKVWDVDTHISPTVERLEPYFDPEFRREKLPELEPYKTKGRADRENPDHHHYNYGSIRYGRILGQSETNNERSRTRTTGAYRSRKRPAIGVEDDDVDARIRDMDEEGVDVQIMVPGVPEGLALLDPEYVSGFTRAYHRSTADFCAEYPDRLKAYMSASGDDVEGSVQEIKTWASSKWAAGVWVTPGINKPLDHPDMEPLWQAIEEAGLAVVHHSTAYNYPYFPGYQDVWDNLFLGRLFSHPWGGMRATAAFLGAGILDRHPNLRFVVLECGCGWLPFLARRADEQVEYVGSTASLDKKISEYMMDGRFFCSIEMHEGEDMIQMVNQLLGDGVLMYASDYPHPETKFPDSVDTVMAWKTLSEETRHKLFWGNAERAFGEP